MVVIVIILSIILIFLLWLLFIPFLLSVNTFTDRYKIGLPGIAVFSLYKTNEKWNLKSKFLNIPVNIKNIMKKGKHKESHNEIKERNTSRNTPKMLQLKWIKKALMKLFKSIRIKRIYAEIDTGDVITNAALYPTIALLGIDQQNIYINYENKNNIDLIASIQLYKILLIATDFIIKQKYYSLKNK